MYLPFQSEKVPLSKNLKKILQGTTQLYQENGFQFAKFVFL